MLRMDDTVISVWKIMFEVKSDGIVSDCIFLKFASRNRLIWTVGLNS